MKALQFFLFTSAVFLALAFLSPARAGGAVPLTVTNCANDSELRDAVSELQNGEGGTLNFNCGTATIVLTSTLPEITHDTLIDGSNKITLSGNNAARLLRIAANGKLRLKNIVLEKGYGQNDNGGAILNNGTLILEHTTVQDSYTPYDGGAIASFGPLEIYDSTFQRNIAGFGGALLVMNNVANTVSAKIQNSTFSKNSGSATLSGGAIYSSAPLKIYGSALVENGAGRGGAVYLNHAVELSYFTETRFDKNRASGVGQNSNGGAFAADVARVQMDALRFTENSADGGGGGLYISPNSQVEVYDSTFEFNLGTKGGGLNNKGKVVFGAGTFYHNSAGEGGALVNFGELHVYNSTISENDAEWGGGLANDGSGVADLIYVTLANNSAVDGAALWNGPGNTKLSLVNIIAADSQMGDNCFFDVPSFNVNNSLSSDNTCNFGVGRDNVNVKLAPLADNGGLTRTHLLLPGSPAIDTAAIAYFPTDQRGVARPQGSGLDIGALEVACPMKPDKPVLVKPKKNAKIKTTTALLDWNDAQCANKYKVIVKLDSPNGAKIQAKGGLAESRFTTKSLTKGKTYAWRVIAINAFGKTKSDWWTFNVK